MYHNKITNISDEFKQHYIKYIPHQDGKSLDIKSYMNMNKSFINTLSIDPGSRNFAIRKQKRINEEGKLKIVPLIYDRLDMKLTDGNIIEAVHRYLDLNYEKNFKDCHLIIVEKQMAVNYTTVRISQAIISYFMAKMANNSLHTLIIEISPKMKGDLLGAGKLTKLQLKQWAVEKATEMLTLRNDNESLTVLRRHNKKDDLSDCVLQEEAAWIMLMS